MSKVLLVDMSPLLYGVWNTPMKNFTTQAGELTGIRFGVLRSLMSYAQKTQADEVVCVFDAPPEEGDAIDFRKVIDADYKANRVWTEDKELMYSQVGSLKEALRNTKFYIAQAMGFEADDVIATLARKFQSQDMSVVIVTPDNDLVQLVSPGIMVWMPPKKGKPHWIKDAGWIHDQFGVRPECLCIWRSIQGDTSDNIKGVKIGRNMSARIRMGLNVWAEENPNEDLSYEKFSNLLYGERDGSPWPTIGEELHQHMDVIRKNYALSYLATASPLDMEKGTGDERDLNQMFTDLEMPSLLKRVDELMSN